MTTQVSPHSYEGELNKILPTKLLKPTAHFWVKYIQFLKKILRVIIFTSLVLGIFHFSSLFVIYLSRFFFLGLR